MEKHRKNSKNKNIPPHKAEKDPIISKESQDFLKQNGFDKLTKVQETIIPLINSKKNVICCSNLGSGKSLSYLIPIAEQFLKEESHEGLNYIIVAPNREDINLNFEHLKKMINDNSANCGLALGGPNKKKEISRMVTGSVHTLFATPQGLHDCLISDKKVSLDDLKLIVFDDLENMIKLGYSNDLKEIIDIIINIYEIENLQFCFFANEDIEKNENAQTLIKLSGVKNYEKVNLLEHKNNKDNIGVLPKSNNGYAIISQNKKCLFLIQFLRKNVKKKIVIFFSTNKEVLFFKLFLSYFKIESSAIETNSLSGNKSVYNNFVKADEGILLCSNLAKDNFNLPECDWIIHFDAPKDAKDYFKKINFSNSLSYASTKSFILLFETEIGLLDEIKGLTKYDVNENKIFVNEQKKVEKIIDQKSHVLYYAAIEAYKSYLVDYAMRGDFDKLDPTKICKNFGFNVPPYINLSISLPLDKQKKIKKIKLDEE